HDADHDSSRLTSATRLNASFRHTIFSFHQTVTTECSTLSLHDALPISSMSRPCCTPIRGRSDSSWAICANAPRPTFPISRHTRRSEEHTSELQSHLNLVCRLLLENKK